MALSTIEAQGPAVRTLSSSIRRSMVAHAYLFAGPKSCGKTTTALAFAAALNCENRTPEGDACGICMSCARIQAGTDADVTLISPDGNQTKIDQMQEMIKSLHYAPFSGRYKIAIIEQADTLNSSSENCILKVLEEPPSYGVLILLSCNHNSLLPTIRSRCRSVRFRRASTLEVVEVIGRRFDLPEDQIRPIAACSQGAIGRALSLATDSDFMTERRAVLQAVRDWSNGPEILCLSASELIRDLATPRKNDPDTRTRVVRLVDMLGHVLSWFDDLLSLKVCGPDAGIVNADYASDLHAQADRYSLDRLRTGIQSIIATRRYIEGNITPQLALENMFFSLRSDL